MALACHPSSDFFVNPALTLAEHLSGGGALFVGTDAIGDGLAAHACRSLASLAGRPGSWLSAAEAAASPPCWTDRRAPPTPTPSTTRTSSRRAPARVRPVIVTGSVPGRAGHALAARLQSVLPRAFHVADEGAEETVAEAVADARAADPRLAGPAGAARPLDPDDEDQRPGHVSPITAEFTALLAQATRIDFASVYLGLVGGARPPTGRPGRARAGRTG